MEEEILNQQNEDTSIKKDNDSIEMTPSMKDTLQKTSIWSKFLAIISFISSGLVFIFAITVLINGIYGMKNLAIRIFMFLIYLAIAGVYSWIGVYILNFYKGISNGLKENNQDCYEKGFNNLKNLFQLIGILAIIGLFFFLISMITMIFASSQINNINYL